MSGALIMPINGSVNRLQERLDLKELHDQLVNYIQHVQDLKYKSNSVDSSAFIESIKVMEDGVTSMRNAYEIELNKARLEIEDVNRAKNEFAQEMHKARDRAAALDNRLAQESERNRLQQEELNDLHRTLAARSAALQEASQAIKGPEGDLNTLRREYEQLLRENQDLRKKYDAEQLHRQEVQEKNHLMQEKLLFTEDRSRQEAQDLQERLNAANATILTLESKVRELASPNTNPIEMIARVREAAEAQLRMYREESEMSFSKSLTALKIQIDGDMRKIEELTNQNVRQTGEIGELMATVRKMEGQIGSLEHQKVSLQEIMARERHQAQEHIQFLEGKLKDIQEILMDKMRELNIARDAQLPLKAEIEALKTLLEEEQKRLSHLPNIGIVPRPAYGQSGPVMPRLPQTITDPQPVGPVRARSAPVSERSKSLNLISSSLGQGRDYFDQMFNDLKRNILKVHNEDGESSCRPNNPSPPTASPVDRPLTADGSYSPNSSAVGDLKILEVHPEGKYVRLINTSEGKDAEIGGFILQQNVGGHPVAVFRFPARVHFSANTTLTVWSGSSDPMMHQPPTDFRFTEQARWGTGSQCTTILCKPNGQAVAWTTSPHRFARDAYQDDNSQGNEGSQTATRDAYQGDGSQTATRDAYEAQSNDATSENTNNNHSKSSQDIYTVDDLSSEADMNKEEELPVHQPPVNGHKPKLFYIRREKEKVPSLLAQKHPHGSNPSDGVHPATGQARPRTYGNDNSSVNKQSRSQSSRPDPIPGAPYAGAAAQRMGSGSLRRYTPANAQGSGAIANKAAGIIRHGPPTPFLSPLQQDYTLAHDSKITNLLKV